MLAQKWEHLKTILTPTRSFTTHFKLKKKSPKLVLATQFLVSGLFAFSILFFTGIFTQGAKPLPLGDSILTNLIIEKDIDQVFTYKTIGTKNELEEIAKEKTLGFSFYRILPGENLYSVATKFGLSIATVLSLNSLDNAHSLTIGQKILLSTRSGIILNTTNQESVFNIAERYGISAEETSLVNTLKGTHVDAGTTLFLPNANLTIKAMADILGFQFVNPVPGYRRLSSHFGWRRHPILKRRLLHKGMDFAASIGTPIYAAKEGRIVSSGWTGSFGLTIVIRHNNGFSTLYAHQSKLYVKAGQWVKAGERIGSVGNTGRSTGPHLHFEVRKYGQPKNPIYHGLQL